MPLTVAQLHRHEIGLTEIHVPSGRAAIAPFLITLIPAGAWVGLMLPDPLWMLLALPPIAVVVGVMWVQHKTVRAIPAGVEVQYGPLPWPGDAWAQPEIVAIDVDLNPQRPDPDGPWHAQLGRRSSGFSNAFRDRDPGPIQHIDVYPSVDLYLHGGFEVTLIAGRNVFDKEHARDLTKALRDGLMDPDAPAVR